MPVPASSARLLVVEDDPFIQRLLERLLRPRYAVVARPTVALALEAASRERFDLVLIDINLRQEETGIDLLQQLRQLPGYAEAPMLACTAFVQPHHKALFRAAGFDGQIDKPFTRDVLLGTIAEALGTPAVA